MTPDHITSLRIVALILVILSACQQSTASAQLVQVREIHSTLSKRSVTSLPEQLNVEFYLNYRRVSLNLTRNSDVDINVPITYAEDARKTDNWRAHATHPTIGMYRDLKNEAVISVRSHSVTGKAMRSLKGSFRIDGDQYNIEPLMDMQMDGTAEIFSSGSPITHQVIKSTSMIHWNDSRDIIKPSTTYHSSAHNVKKQKRRLYADYYVELMFILDHTMWEHYSSLYDNDKQNIEENIRYDFSHIMNGINLAFMSIREQASFSVTPILKRILIARTKRMSHWTSFTVLKKNQKMIDVTRTIDRLGSSGFGVYGIDHVMLWTRYDIAVADASHILSAIVGSTSLYGICTDTLSNSVIEYNGLLSWKVASHELAHNLGASHDGEGNVCPESDHYIMTAGVSKSTPEALIGHRFRFSSCAAKHIRDTLSGDQPRQYPSLMFERSCLLNVACKHDMPAVTGTKLPGQIYSLDRQCQIRYGQHSSAKSDENVCLSLSCYNPYFGTYITRSPGAADGTHCGKNKCCLQGKCVLDCNRHIKLQYDPCKEKGVRPTVLVQYLRRRKRSAFY